ncbi:hypothetical protein [Oleiharenicola sp. Vm1]|uniref:hypothetical protein n=1 Tax=Oleiharenicola sp. Vm1 TaxID=3398393 RepID=UPI0039F5F8BC
MLSIIATIPFNPVIAATITMWEALSWGLPLACVYAAYEGISQIIKGAKSREKEERTSEVFWGFVITLAPMIVYGLLLKFTPVTVPFADSLPF